MIVMSDEISLAMEWPPRWFRFNRKANRHLNHCYIFPARAFTPPQLPEAALLIARRDCSLAT
jgi:hypothetical protein